MRKIANIFHQGIIEFACLVSCALTNVMFALDSIPTTFAITQEAFLVLAENVLPCLVYLHLVAVILHRNILRFDRLCSRAIVTVNVFTHLQCIILIYPGCQINEINP